MCDDIYAMISTIIQFKCANDYNYFIKSMFQYYVSVPQSNLINKLLLRFPISKIKFIAYVHVAIDLCFIIQNDLKLILFLNI